MSWFTWSSGGDPGFSFRSDMHGLRWRHFVAASTGTGATPTRWRREGNEVDGRCAGCKVQVQTIPGPAEKGERTYRLSHTAVRVAYRYEDANGQRLICNDCMSILMAAAMQKYDESCESK